MNQEIEQDIEEIIYLVKNSYEYQKCIELKQKMSKNKELVGLIEEVKALQKEYIRKGEIQIKKELGKSKSRLDEIPIYVEYNQYLQQVNEKLEMIKESLNQYFDQKLNGYIL